MLLGRTSSKMSLILSTLKVTVIKHAEMSIWKKKAMFANLQLEFPFYGHTVGKFIVIVKGFILVGSMLLSFRQADDQLWRSVEQRECDLYDKSTKFFIVHWYNMVIALKNSN